MRVAPPVASSSWRGWHCCERNSREQVLADRLHWTRLLISEHAYDEIHQQVCVGGEFDTALEGKSGRYKLYEIVGLKA